MTFSYYDKNNEIKSLNLQVGLNWSEIAPDNEILNSIFTRIDDGDGSVSSTEISILEDAIERVNKNPLFARDSVFSLLELTDLKNALSERVVARMHNNVVKNYKVEDFTLENLRKKFPEDKFVINFSLENNLNGYIAVFDKEGSQMLYVVIKRGKLDFIHDTSGGQIVINEYDEDGNLESYFNHNRKIVYPQAEKLAGSLKNQIYKKNALGIPVTADKLGSTVYKINPNNVLQVMKAYSQKAGSDANLMDDIISEVGLDIDTRVKYLMHIKNALVEYYRQRGIYVDDMSSEFNRELRYQDEKIGFADGDYLNVFIDTLRRRYEIVNRPQNIAPNGQIDENFQQGNTGDCWLVASIVVLNNTPKGREILNETVKLNSDGSVTVHLKGVNKRYTISREDLDGNTQLATSDLDVRAIEIAVNRYFYEERGVNDSLDINGNFSTVAYEILTGKGVSEDDMYENGFLDAVIHGRAFGSRLPYRIQFDDDMIDGFNNSSKVITVASHDKGETYACSQPETGAEITLLEAHAYAVIGSDENNVFLINPYDSSTTMTVSREDFKRFFNCCQQMTL